LSIDEFIYNYKNRNYIYSYLIKKDKPSKSTYNKLIDFNDDLSVECTSFEYLSVQNKNILSIILSLINEYIVLIVFISLWITTLILLKFCLEKFGMYLIYTWFIPNLIIYIMDILVIENGIILFNLVFLIKNTNYLYLEDNVIVMKIDNCCNGSLIYKFIYENIIDKRIAFMYLTSKEIKRMCINKEEESKNM